jgi:GAF domain-containing protein
MAIIEHKAIQEELRSLISSTASVEVLMQNICELLNRQFLKYNWVGFYTLDKDDPNTLVIGPFVGAMTPHTRIPLDEGICGAAVSTGETVVVDDVNADPRYLACSLETKSEIVVPIFVNGKIIGEIDIDSHFPAAFTTDDRALIEYCAVEVGSYIKLHSA